MPLDEMRRQRDEARDAHTIAIGDVIAAQARAAHAEARLAAAETRIQALEAALRPFAEMAKTYDGEDYGDDYNVVSRLTARRDCRHITLGDLGRAAALASSGVEHAPVAATRSGGGS